MREGLTSQKEKQMKNEISVVITIANSDQEIEVVRGEVVPTEHHSFAAVCIGKMADQEFPFEIRNLSAVFVVQFDEDAFLGHVGRGLGDLREFVGFDGPQQWCGVCHEKMSAHLKKCFRCGGKLEVKSLQSGRANLT